MFRWIDGRYWPEVTEITIFSTTDLDVGIVENIDNLSEFSKKKKKMSNLFSFTYFLTLFKNVLLRRWASEKEEKMERI